MEESGKTSVQIVPEITALHQRIATLEAAAAQQQGKEAWYQGEAKFRHLVEASPQGTLVHRHYKPLFVNSAFARLYGYATLEEILNMETIMPLIAPQEQTRVMAPCQVCLCSDSIPVQFEFQGLRQDGESLWVTVRATIVPWDGLPAVLITSNDITERKRVEVMLARYYFMSEQTRDIALFIHHDGQIIDANHAAVAAYGYERELLLTMTIYDLRAPTTAPLVAQQMWQAGQGGILFETVHQRKDGSTFPVEVRSSGADIGGEHLLLSIIRDITACKQAAEALRQSEERFAKAFNASPHLVSISTLAERQQAEEAVQQARLELEQRVEERTVALRQEMAERQRLEREAQRVQYLALLGRLAAGVSHEIRNPLGAVFLHVDLLAEELQQPSADSTRVVTETLGEIKANLARLEDLVQDYLSLVRAHAMQRQIQNLGQAVQAWSTEFQEMAEACRVTLQHSGLANLGAVAFHYSTLRRALLNLVQNALDATPPGGLLTIAGQQTATHVQIQVRDTGRGIPAERLERLFEPLYTTKPGGTGLGLYIVQEIAAAHGGRVTVESAVGQGSNFTLTLPLQPYPSSSTMDVV